jgi:hypothetical protein
MLIRALIALLDYFLLGARVQCVYSAAEQSSSALAVLYRAVRTFIGNPDGFAGFFLAVSTARSATNPLVRLITSPRQRRSRCRRACPAMGL